MGFLFPKHKPRGFRHHPIYYDPEREALERRIARIKRELIEKGEISDDTPLPEREEDLAVKDEPQWEEELHSALRSKMSHLPRQEARGVAGADRAGVVFRILLMLAFLVVIVWLLFFRR